MALHDILFLAPSPLCQIWAVQQALGSVTPNFSIAAAFGNVHGVYKPGNVKLNPGILATHQASLLFSKSGKSSRSLTTSALQIGLLPPGRW